MNIILSHYVFLLNCSDICFRKSVKTKVDQSKQTLGPVSTI